MVPYHDYKKIDENYVSKEYVNIAIQYIAQNKGRITKITTRRNSECRAMEIRVDFLIKPKHMDKWLEKRETTREEMKRDKSNYEHGFK